MSRGTRVALIGCGRWGANCLRDLKSLGCDVTVVAASQDSLERARSGGASRIVSKVAELPDVQGIVVATPTSTHGQVVESVLDRGVPVFVEKPLTADPYSARRLAEAAPDLIFVMDKWRYHAGVEALRDIAVSGELGPVIGLRSVRAQWNTNHQDVDGLWILAPHDLSICLEILGFIPEPSGARGEESGGKAHSLVAFLGDRPWFVMEISARYPRYIREIRLVCRDGIAILEDGYAESIRIFRSTIPEKNEAPAPELRPISQELPLLKELRAFVEHLNGGPPPRSSAAEGAKIVDTLARLREMAGLDRATSAVC
ncbi:MAG TPA: Gfo/Idh/MocA family oxidoreductase [Candidatus Obscuribacterales bacterium]